MRDIAEERWHTGIGDGAGVYLCRPGEPLNSHEKIADFGRGGRAPGGSEAAAARAALAAEAPQLAASLAELQCRACGCRIGEERAGDDRCACTEARAVLAKARGLR